MTKIKRKGTPFLTLLMRQNLRFSSEHPKISSHHFIAPICGRIKREVVKSLSNFSALGPSHYQDIAFKVNHTVLNSNTTKFTNFSFFHTFELHHYIAASQNLTDITSEV